MAPVDCPKDDECIRNSLAEPNQDIAHKQLAQSRCEGTNNEKERNARRFFRGCRGWWLDKKPLQYRSRQAENDAAEQRVLNSAFPSKARYQPAAAHRADYHGNSAHHRLHSDSHRVLLPV